MRRGSCCIGLRLLARIEVMPHLQNVELVQLEERHLLDLGGKHRPVKVADQRSKRRKGSLSQAAGEFPDAAVPPRRESHPSPRSQWKRFSATNIVQARSRFNTSTARNMSFRLTGGVKSCMISHMKPFFVCFFSCSVRNYVAVRGKLFVDVIVTCSACGPDRKAVVVIAAEPAVARVPTPTAEAADLPSLEAGLLVLMPATTPLDRSARLLQVIAVTRCMDKNPLLD